MKNYGLSLDSMVLPNVDYKVETANETLIVNERTLRVILQHIKEGAIRVDEIRITDSIGTVATFNSDTYLLNVELFGLNPSIII